MKKTVGRAHSTSLLLLIACALTLLSACADSSKTYNPVSNHTVTPTHTAIATVVPTPVISTTPVPQRYTAHIFLQGIGRPDDLAIDNQGNLIFSDFYNGTISRVNPNKTVTILIRGIAGPEGLVTLPDGRLIFAEQRANRILIYTPGAPFPSVLRGLPGKPSSASCKDGVDGIALDPTTNTLIVPDSPTGNVYRMSLDGRTLTLLASGITRPVGVAVDSQGNIYIADECGAALWRLTPSGAITRSGGFGMPDDIAIDPYGNLLVTDLQPAIHALIRVNLTTGQRQTLASRGFIEPQGLIVDPKGNIFVSDDYADIIMEYTPA